MAPPIGRVSTGPYAAASRWCRFEPHSDGSRVTLEVRTEGLVPGIAGRLLATGSYRGSFRGDLRSFARLAEREHWGQLVI